MPTCSRMAAPRPSKQTGGWLGMTDKYWAAALIPDQKLLYDGQRLGGQGRARSHFQTDFAAGRRLECRRAAKRSSTSNLFAGAKQVTLIEAYHEKLGAKQFDLLIDWGWFYFITKPLFKLLHWLSQVLGNYGLAILATTVLVKAAFFPLANKSYESMAKMKKLQPEMEKIRDRFKDDRVKQQQELMALYKNEKINPMSGCLPIVLQIPVFFALYKVLFVTIDMRHAPFFGWIKDLSAPDPTSLFNLFGLLPYQVPEYAARRRVAADHGRDDVGADAAEPAAARPRAAEDLQLDAGDLHLHAGVVPVRPGDLLGLEQRAVAAAAVHDHAQEQHRGPPVEEPRRRQVEGAAGGGEGRRHRQQAEGARRQRLEQLPPSRRQERSARGDGKDRQERRRRGRHASRRNERAARRR